MSDQKIKNGEVVRLKSGGPKMTATYVGTSEARCVWFDMTMLSPAEVANRVYPPFKVWGQRHSEMFDIDSLERADKQDP